MKKVLFIFGTRPEAIKMAPLIKEFCKEKSPFDVKTCVTGQHREMLDQVLDFFEITPDFDLNLMKANQTLFDITTKALQGIEKVLDQFEADLIFVQGDTTTAFVGALAGYYRKIEVAHIEAGLRSGDRYSPFPEEINRVLAGNLSTYHFAPTEKAKENLNKENINENVFVVGNTVIDSLFLGLDIISRGKEEQYSKDFSSIDFDKKVILVTGHRRESFGKPFENICLALKQIVDEFDNVEIVYPVHLNPNVQQPVKTILGKMNRVHLIDPLPYPQLIWLMNKCYLVLTDSGGIQEEAPSLGKPVLVMREVTERVEGIAAGTALLVSTDPSVIVDNARQLLTNSDYYNSIAKAQNPYGDGASSGRVFESLLQGIEINQ